MKKNRKKLVIFFVAIVFLIQLGRGFHIFEHDSNFVFTGAMNSPSMVVFSAVLSGAIVWLLLEAIFWLIAKIRNLKGR